MSKYFIFFFFFSFLLGCKTINQSPLATKDDIKNWDTIFKKVKQNIQKNYGVPHATEISYKEYVFQDSTKKLLKATSIKGYQKKIGIDLNKPPFFSSKNYIISGEHFDNQKEELGFAHPMLLEFPGNFYSNIITSEIYNLIVKKRESLTNANPAICRNGASFEVKIDYIEKEVKDTVINNVNYYLLIEVKKENFSLVKENPYVKYKGVSEWNSFIRNQKTKYLINALDYALVDFETSLVYENENTENKFYSNSKNKFVKQDSFYYENYYELNMPRFKKNICGFNQDNLKTLIIKKQNIVPAKKDKELDLYKVEIQVPIEKICRKLNALNPNLSIEWTKFIENT